MFCRTSLNSSQDSLSLRAWWYDCTKLRRPKNRNKPNAFLGPWLDLIWRKRSYKEYFGNNRGNLSYGHHVGWYWIIVDFPGIVMVHGYTRQCPWTWKTYAEVLIGEVSWNLQSTFGWFGKTKCGGGGGGTERTCWNIWGKTTVAEFKWRLYT